MEREDNRLAYQGKIEAQLKEWGSQIDLWQDRGMGGNRQLLEELNHKRQTVRRKLAEMKDVSDEQWQTLTAELDGAVEDMRSAMSDAREQFPLMEV